MRYGTRRRRRQRLAADGRVPIVALAAGAIALLAVLDPASSVELSPTDLVAVGLPLLAASDRERSGERHSGPRAAIADALREGVVLLDADDRVVDLDDAARRLLAIGDENAIGRRFESLCSLQTSAIDRSTAARVVGSGPSPTRESVTASRGRVTAAVLPRPSEGRVETDLAIDVAGETRSLRLRSRPLSGDRNDAIDRAIVVREITATGDLEATVDRLRRSNADLAERNRRLAIANELLRTGLRDDLCLVVGLSDQLRERVDPPDRAVLDSVLSASRHALDAADAVAELVEVISANPAAIAEPVDLGAVLRTELERVESDPDVDLSVDWRVPDGEPLSVAGAPELGSALTHLLSSAAARAEGDVARIAVTVEATSDRASVSIAGDGAALSEVQRAPLRDVDAANRAGVGVALYFVATVLERIGADLAIEDGESRGTVVTVTLDRVDDR